MLASRFDQSQPVEYSCWHRSIFDIEQIWSLYEDCPILFGDPEQSVSMLHFTLWFSTDSRNRWRSQDFGRSTHEQSLRPFLLIQWWSYHSDLLRTFSGLRAKVEVSIKLTASLWSLGLLRSFAADACCITCGRSSNRWHIKECKYTS